MTHASLLAQLRRPARWFGLGSSRALAAGTLGVVLLAAGSAPPLALAECPALNEVEFTTRDAAVVLPSGPSVPLLKIAGDTCTDANPPATLVIAKVMLENYSTSKTATVECSLSSTKATDLVQVTLGPLGMATVALQIANVAGGAANSSVTSLACRTVTADADGDITSANTKITTKTVRAVKIVQNR